MSKTSGMITSGRCEAERLAGELRFITKRIGKTLPLRKYDVKENLREIGKSVEAEIIRAGAERSVERALSALHSARNTARLGYQELDELSMIQMGGAADVTAALELYERLVEALGHVISLMTDPPPAT